MSDLFWLSDAQMARLEPYFPKSHGKPSVDDRRVLSGIIFIKRNGLRWRDAPAEYGPNKRLYNSWKRWSDKGIFARMMAGLAAGHADVLDILVQPRPNAKAARRFLRKLIARFDQPRVIITEKLRRYIKPVRQLATDTKHRAMRLHSKIPKRLSHCNHETFLARE